MDSESSIDREKHAVKNPRGQKPQQPNTTRAAKTERVFHAELKLMSKGTQFLTLARRVYSWLSKGEQSQSGFDAGQRFKEGRSDTAE